MRALRTGGVRLVEERSDALPPLEREGNLPAPRLVERDLLGDRPAREHAALRKVPEHDGLAAHEPFADELALERGAAATAGGAVAQDAAGEGAAHRLQALAQLVACGMEGEESRLSLRGGSSSSSSSAEGNLTGAAAGRWGPKKGGCAPSLSVTRDTVLRAPSGG